MTQPQQSTIEAKEILREIREILQDALKIIDNDDCKSLKHDRPVR